MSPTNILCVVPFRSGKVPQSMMLLIKIEERLQVAQVLFFTVVHRQQFKAESRTLFVEANLTRASCGQSSRCQWQAAHSQGCLIWLAQEVIMTHIAFTLGLHTHTHTRRTAPFTRWGIRQCKFQRVCRTQRNKSEVNQLRCPSVCRTQSPSQSPHGFVWTKGSRVMHRRDSHSPNAQTMSHTALPKQ